ncbi:14-3-3 protein zeta/delta-like [Branchiostoma floridae]|uniref:14-3-3 protein zeta/delta-like n=1 Tax=Branchiostoma floridae TaxID=7739 RepID=A0A9J7MW51_BRAFL|nr:14-3-3 protein zeta/delta-like [Branchiostoma floridae]
MADKNLLVAKARMTEQAERWDDMVLCMKELVELDVVLTEEERNLLSSAYKNTVGARRNAWRVLTEMEQRTTDKGRDNIELAKGSREKVETELKEMCGDVVSLLDKFLIPRADTAESEVFYWKMKGDYFRYQAEISKGDEEGMVTKGKKVLESYCNAQEKAAQLPTTHPLRLRLALNLSEFHYEIGNPEVACRLAREAFDAAIPEMDGLYEESTYKDTELVMQLLRDNLTLWSTEVEDKREY